MSKEYNIKQIQESWGSLNYNYLLGESHSYISGVFSDINYLKKHLEETKNIVEVTTDTLNKFSVYSQNPFLKNYFIFQKKINTQILSDIQKNRGRYNLYLFDCDIQDSSKKFFNLFDVYFYLRVTKEKQVIDLKNNKFRNVILNFDHNIKSCKIKSLNKETDSIGIDIKNFYDQEDQKNKTIYFSKIEDQKLTIKSTSNHLVISGEKTCKSQLNLAVNTLSNQSKITIKNMNIQSFQHGSSSSNSRINELKIQGARVTKKIVIPPFRNLILKSVYFKYPFKLDDNADPLEVIDQIYIENINFECGKNQDGEFNKIKQLMKKLGYDNYAIDFNAFANKSRYKNLSWRSTTEKALLWFYGVVSDCGLNIRRMFISLGGLFAVFYLVYFLGFYYNYETAQDVYGIEVESFKQSVVNSLGAFKILFKYESSLTTFCFNIISFVHTSLSSIIWYLIIIWMKKRFGQK